MNTVRTPKGQRDKVLKKRSGSAGSVGVRLMEGEVLTG
jgi:hypothetical protein